MTMPQGPNGQKRPAGVIGNTVHIARIATGDVVEPAATDDGRDIAAILLGRRGGFKGGRARAEVLSPERRREIATRAARARWGKPDE